MNKLAKSDLKNIGKMAKEKASRAEIAHVYGVTAPAISYVLKQLGITATPGTRGRRAKGYSLAQSPSPTLRRIAMEKGLIGTGGEAAKSANTTAAAHKPASTPAHMPAKAAAPAPKANAGEAKPWEYHGIYDPEKGRIITPSEMKQSIAKGKSPGSGRQPGTAGKAAGSSGRKKVAAKKKSKPAIGEVPETAPGSGTEEQQGETVAAETTNSIAATAEIDSAIIDAPTGTAIPQDTGHHAPGPETNEPDAIPPADATATEDMATETEAVISPPETPPGAPLHSAPLDDAADDDFVVPDFLKPSTPAEGSRPRISTSTIMVAGHGRSPRPVQVSRISRPGTKKAGFSGVAARHFSNVALVVQTDLVETAGKLEEEVRNLLAATKGSVSPKHLYRSEIASHVKSVLEMVDKLEISLLQL